MCIRDRDKDCNFITRKDGSGRCLGAAQHSPSGIWAKYAYPFLVIENDDNKKYINISCWDKLRNFLPGGNDYTPSWDLENCVEIFATAGIQRNETDYKPLDIKYTPISMYSHTKPCEDRIQELYRTKTSDGWDSIPDKPRFRGHPGYGQTDIPAPKEHRWHFRDFLEHKGEHQGDDRFEMKTEKLPPNDFIDELNRGAFNIDINGAAEATCRTPEIMGLGKALIRPKLGIKFHNELIPDYHYAALDCDNLANFEALADAYIEKWNELKNDKDQVYFLAANGRKWFEENATIDAHVKILENLINFDKLI